MKRHWLTKWMIAILPSTPCMPVYNNHGWRNWKIPATHNSIYGSYRTYQVAVFSQFSLCLSFSWCSVGSILSFRSDWVSHSLKRGGGRRVGTTYTTLYYPYLVFCPSIPRESLYCSSSSSSGSPRLVQSSSTSAAAPLLRLCVRTYVSQSQHTLGRWHA